MFHIFILVLLSGQPAGVAETTKGYDTKEACIAAIAATVTDMSDNLNPGYTVGTAVCSTEEDFKKASGKPDTEAAK